MQNVYKKEYSDPRLQMFTLFTNVNTNPCIDLLKESRPLSFRVSKLIWYLYDILSKDEKNFVKTAVEGIVYSIASSKTDLPCKEKILNKFNLNQDINKSMIVFNINIASSSTNMNVNLNEIIEFLEKLVNPPSGLIKPVPWIRIEAEKLLKKLSHNN